MEEEKVMQGIGAYVATKKSLIGIDWLNLSSGVLKGAGGAFGGGGGGDAQAAAEKARLEAEKKAAEEKANTWKLVGFGVLLLGGVAYLVSRKG
jgi:hypothetical protein